jgi:gluconokinase
MILVMMGVTASGKTTVGKLLAQETGWSFVEGDDVHSPANRRKMQQGIPLTDEDRAPWLSTLHEILLGWSRSGASGILACSALKRSYRDQLSKAIPGIHFVWLEVSPSVLEERLRGRQGHYMNPKLLGSQLDTLEAPTPAEAIRVSGELPPEEIAQQILQRLAREQGSIPPMRPATPLS